MKEYVVLYQTGFYKTIYVNCATTIIILPFTVKLRLFESIDDRDDLDDWMDIALE